jgi:hypothetical protein
VAYTAANFLIRNDIPALFSRWADAETPSGFPFAAFAVGTGFAGWWTIADGVALKLASFCPIFASIY